MKLSGHPIAVAVALALVASVFACTVAVLLMRRMRRVLVEQEFLAAHPDLEQFPLHAYHSVIQELKQQKHELLSAQQVERRRAKTSENVSAAVLSNLSSGVLFLTPNGLVRKANTAARNILGFASPAGLNMAQIFRDASLISAFGSREKLAARIQASLREHVSSQTVESQYLTPSGEERVLEVTMTPVWSPSGEVLGAACLINDKTEMALIRKQQELRGELSAEMALALRSSLATILGYAQQLAASRDPELARQLAADIASEAAQLDHTIGGFLAGPRAARAAAGT